MMALRCCLESFKMGLSLSRLLPEICHRPACALLLSPFPFLSSTRPGSTKRENTFPRLIRPLLFAVFWRPSPGSLRRRCLGAHSSSPPSRSTGVGVAVVISVCMIVVFLSHQLILNWIRKQEEARGPATMAATRTIAKISHNRPRRLRGNRAFVQLEE